jgi:hypothetical protein
MTMSTIDLQLRRPGPRAERLLEELQSSVAEGERVRWDDTGHARIPLGHERDDARENIAERLSELGEDWRDHIAIL